MTNSFVRCWERDVFPTRRSTSIFGYSTLKCCSRRICRNNMLLENKIGMTDGGSIVTMSYYGAEKVVANYNVMGVAKAALEASTRYLAADLGKNNIRVNAISAGPINTLSARGVKNMGSMLNYVAERAPLK